MKQSTDPSPKPSVDHPVDEKNDESQNESSGEDEQSYPPFRTVIVIMLAIYLAMFLVSLDRIIISTAIPKITDEFQSIQDIGWYGSAYVLTGCSVQLLFGRIFSFYNHKLVFLSAIVLFEAGSALCGAAPNSTAFILGRALAGAGSAGVFSGAIVITIPLVPLEKRPMYQGFMGGIFGISSVLGPLIGGAFTNNINLTWRWCFYINLPIGAVSILLITLFLRLPPSPPSNLTKVEKLKRMDPIGTLLLTPSIVCLLLALQWGGSTDPWSSPRIIALLTLFPILFIAWIISQVLGGENATVPLHVFRQRSIMAAVAFATCIGATMLPLSIMLALWFQGVQGVDALTSGIRTLPFVLALVVGAVSAGAGVSRLGYYTPFVIACTCLISIGSGLLTTLQVGSSNGEWIGFQVILGFGTGLGMQQPSVAAQTVLEKKDVPIGASLMFFGQNLGGAVFISVAQNVFIQELVKDLAGVLSTGGAQVLAGVGATDLREVVPAEQLPGVVFAYNKAVTTTFYVGVAVACFSIVPALAFEWRSVKGGKGKKGAGDAEGGKGEDSHA